MSDNTSAPEPENSSTGNSHGKDSIDSGQIQKTALEYLKNPASVLQDIQSTFSDPGAFFGSDKGGDINKSLGFFLCMGAYYFAFAVLRSIFSLSFIGIVMAIPFTLIGMAIGLVISSLVIWALGILAGKGEGTFLDGVRITCHLSWIGLISAIPIFVWFPFLLQTLISVACLVLWAYLLIPSITARFSTTQTTHKLVIWVLAALFGSIQLIGALVGTGAQVVGDAYADRAEEILMETQKEVERMQKEALVAHQQQQQQEAAAAAAAEQEAMASQKATPQANPQKDVKNILKQLRGLGAVEVPRELKQAFRKYNGHLQEADFSGIEVINLDLRMLDLRGASFKNAQMIGWTFHGIGNTPASNLDGADFSGATIQDVNMTGVSAKGADFSGATLVGTGRAKTVLDLEEANVQGADFSDIKFTGDSMAKALYLGRANLEGAELKDSQLPNSDFTKARMRGADLSGAILRGAVLNGADIRDARFRDCDLEGMQISSQMKLDNHFIPFDTPMPMTEGADFSGARLNQVNFNNRKFRFCNFTGTSFIGADLEGGNFVGSSFKNADLTNAILKRANFAAVDFSGAKFHNNDWESAHTAGAKLSDLNKASPVYLPNLPEGSSMARKGSGKDNEAVGEMVEGSRKNWAGADLKGVSFAKKRLTQVDFSGANLQGAVFDYAELGRCNFSLANLKKASFVYARINQCIFNEADLTGASFEGAVFSSNSFQKAVLEDVNFTYTGRAQYSVSDKINFEEANLEGATFAHARLSAVPPSRIVRTNTSSRAHLKSMARGGNSGYIDFDNANLRNANLQDADLEDVSLAGTDLSGVDGRNANIAAFYSTWDTIWNGANFSGANMSYGQLWHKGATRVTNGHTDFARANVTGANLYAFAATPGTHIGAADFSDCVFGVDPWGRFTGEEKDYGGADLTLLNLEGAKFDNADLRKTNFMNSRLNGASFANADLRYTSWSIGNSIQAAADLEPNLGDYVDRYKNIDFTGANLGEADIMCGDFSGSTFRNVSAPDLRIHRANTNTEYQFMSYTYGVPEL